MPVITLDGSPTEHTIAPNYTLTAPRLIGRVAPATHPRSLQRGGDSAPPLPGLDQALTLTQTAVEQSILLDIERVIGPAPSGSTRSAAQTRTLRTPMFSANVGQAVLYTDEASGISQWIFPVHVDSTPARRGGARVVYYLPDDSPPEPEAPGTQRGAIIKGIRKVVRVISWYTDELLGHTIESFVAGWEARRRAYGWQMVPLNNREDVDWSYVRGGRCLLLLHGTMSTAEAAFGALPSATVEALRSIYAGRVIAFSHPTLASDPAANVDTLLDTLPPDLALDIVAHSRGGLVARDLLRRISTATPLQVGKLIMVATPNRGTRLVDGDHWLEMLDRYTSLLADLPDTTATVMLEGVLTLIKVIGHSGLRQLAGLAAMTPNSTFLQHLNSEAAADPRLFALAAEYQPTDSLWVKRFLKQQGDGLIDTFFEEANDGVVPTSGGYQADDQAAGWHIPAAQRVIFPSSERIHHSGFFGNAVVGRQLVDWLKRA